MTEKKNPSDALTRLAKDHLKAVRQLERLRGESITSLVDRIGPQLGALDQVAKTISAIPRFPELGATIADASAALRLGPAFDPKLLEQFRGPDLGRFVETFTLDNIIGTAWEAVRSTLAGIDSGLLEQMSQPLGVGAEIAKTWHRLESLNLPTLDASTLEAFQRAKDIFGESALQGQAIAAAIRLPEFDASLSESVARAFQKFAASAKDIAAGATEGEIESLAAEADGVVRAASTDEERRALSPLVKLVLLSVLLNVLGNWSTDTLNAGFKTVLPYLLVLLTGSAPPALPPSPSLPVVEMLAPAAEPQAGSLVMQQSWQLEGLPSVIQRAGPKASRRTLEFFTTEIRNRNTRQAYAHAVQQFFNWCDDRNVELQDISPFTVAAYVEELQRDYAAPSVKQHLAAIRMLFDYLVVGQVLPMNPAASVRGPKHVVKRGKTPVLTGDQARTLLDSIDTADVAGLRDRALIGVMVYTFARVGAVSRMCVEDYYANGKRWWFRLHEKGGKRHEVPAHHNAEVYVDAYLEAAAIEGQKRGPLFRTLGRDRTLTALAMHRTDILRMIKRRALAAGLPASTCCHTFRATGITAYLENGGTIENAQAIASHESPRTTKLYDRTSDEITLDEVERILI